MSIFVKFEKIPRYENKEKRWHNWTNKIGYVDTNSEFTPGDHLLITEKMDGANVSIHVDEAQDKPTLSPDEEALAKHTVSKYGDHELASLAGLA